MNKHNLRVGQQLYYWPSSKWDRDAFVTISKVGRKWVEFNGPHVRADLETLQADPGRYSSSGRYYLSKADHDAEAARQEKWDNLRCFMANRYTIPEWVTIEDLTEIARIMGRNKEKD